MDYKKKEKEKETKKKGKKSKTRFTKMCCRHTVSPLSTTGTHRKHDNSSSNNNNKSTTNVYMHHFKTTFMCPKSIAGVPFDSDRRFQASLLLHTTCVRSWCNTSAICVATMTIKIKKNGIRITNS